jgi:glycosyltransferase involved in cell wall biosynthesis
LVQTVNKESPATNSGPIGQLRRPRLLFVCERAPDRAGGGLEKRLYSFLHAYGTFCDIELWYGDAPDRLPDDAPQSTRDLCRTVVNFPRGQIAVPTSDRHRALQARLAEVDLVHIGVLHRLIPMISHPRIMWDIDEAPTHLKVRDGWLGRLRRRGRQFRAFMAQQARVENVFVSSALEQSILGARTIIVPNAVSVDRPAPQDDGTADAPVFLFTGTLGYFPNLHGIETFIRRVWPRVLAGCPGARLRVVGRMPAKPHLRERVEKLAGTPNVDFAFNVPDVAPYYHMATAVVAPIWHGGGTRIKIIEAFAYGRAVISTVKGCEGLEAQHGRHLLVGRTMRGLAQQCLLAARDRGLCRDLARNAQAFHHANHSQDIVTDRVRRAVLGEDEA